MSNRKEIFKIAFAYVGVIVGAGLSSGQDILQYFLSFGTPGLIGAAVLGVLNIIFGKIILSLGSCFGAQSHQEVFSHITSPWITRIIDAILIAANFIIGFVMIAGAGSNLKQQFHIPTWMGALICCALIILVSFLDFEKITGILGIFTPIVIVMIALISCVSLMHFDFDFSTLSATASTLASPMPNIFLSVINYFSLCMLTGVSMAFVLGGSILRIDTAKKAGLLGGSMIGLVIMGAAFSMFANIISIKEAEMPMLSLVAKISPVLSGFYALVIFALIFNTAFSLFYADASRFAKGNTRKTRIWMIILVASGYAASFGGFKDLISNLYPILGWLGMIMVLIIAGAWLLNQKRVVQEKYIRRSMVHLFAKKKYMPEYYTAVDQKKLEKLKKLSASPSEKLVSNIKDYGRQLEEQLKHPKAIMNYLKSELPVQETSSFESA